jgi:GNAT superfamily N-acetyltransferase
MRVPWAHRSEDPDDDGVWSVVCFVTRTGYRRQGVSTALAAAAVEHARSRGARAVEGYPLILGPGVTATWGELYVGAHSAFLDAGFREVARPSKRRAVMRLEL